MSTRQRVQLHTDRAFEELERARTAACESAAIAHLGLSELHLARARALSREALRERPRTYLHLVDA